MSHRKIISSLPLLLLVFSATNIYSQRKALPKVEILNTDIKTSLRGLSVVNNNVVWVSGSNGMVGKSSNAGKNWKCERARRRRAGKPSRKSTEEKPQRRERIFAGMN